MKYRVGLEYAGDANTRDNLYKKDTEVCNVLQESAFPNYVTLGRFDNTSGNTHQIRWYRFWDLCIRREWCLSPLGHVLMDDSVAFPPF